MEDDLTLTEDQRDENLESTVVDDEADLLPTQLPLSKVKKMCRLVPSLQMITSEAVKAVTFATVRLFLN